MSRFFVVFVACLAASSAKQQKLSVVAQEPQAQSTGIIGAIEFKGDYSAHGSKKYSSSAELTSLAHSSALQARTAVRNQQVAGIQAAVGAQSGYARAASGAASAAQVALVAKQVIVQNLQRHIEDAERQLQAEQAQYQQTLQAAGAAQNAVQQSQEQLTAATAAFAAVQESVTQTERAAVAAGTAAAAQHQMIQDAQQRLGQLHLRLNEALAGLQETQLSAQRAAAAAQLAQNNAAASAQLAVANSASNQIDEHDPTGYHH
ncbi:hypothetical protein MTP99_015937 [Tenebrio molitor]|uniref:uncharacterized protein n=1 Tax=Tenebrio molitor TaxID=7067 RepID=UPI001C3BE6B5|nr:hypothetical protein MTP99_015937 [Tenebrio molitor]CAH1374623.1 unnamed protein product [Tenebrio molitor]